MDTRFIFTILGAEWCHQKIALSENPDPWMLNGTDNWLRSTNADPNDMRRIVYFSRVTRLADCLFTLFGSNRFTGGDILRKRFLTRPTKPCFIEAEIASTLIVNGFSVHIRSESGRRGMDFDISANFGGWPINVEVTGRDEGLPLSPNAIRNTLNRKWKQLPEDAPAVIYIHVPEKWMEDPRAHRIISSAINPFEIRSGRINAVVFVWEYVTPFLSGGFPHMVMQACYSHGARHRFPAIGQLTPVLQANGNRATAFSFFDKFEARHNATSSNASDPY